MLRYWPGAVDLNQCARGYRTAIGMSRAPVEVSDVLFVGLREHFDEGQIVELTHVIALENMRGRFNLALGIGAAGFREGMVRAVPASAPQPASWSAAAS